MYNHTFKCTHYGNFIMITKTNYSSNYEVMHYNIE